jgi:hypothetical protein
MRTLLRSLAALALLALGTSAVAQTLPPYPHTTYVAPDARNGIWADSSLGWPQQFLRVNLGKNFSDVEFSVTTTCAGRLHNYGQADALNGVVYSTTATTDYTTMGAYCIPLNAGFMGFGGGSNATVQLLAQDCPYPTQAAAAAVINVGAVPVTIPGCYSRLTAAATPTPIDAQWGGIVLEMGDGFVTGKMFQATPGGFLNVMDGYTTINAMFGQTVGSLYQNFTYRYRVIVTNPGYWVPGMDGGDAG